MWNEAVTFEPARLVEDFRAYSELDNDRIAEMMKSASLVFPSFGDPLAPF